MNRCGDSFRLKRQSSTVATIIHEYKNKVYFIKQHKSSCNYSTSTMIEKEIKKRLNLLSKNHFNSIYSQKVSTSSSTEYIIIRTLERMIKNSKFMEYLYDKLE